MSSTPATPRSPTAPPFAAAVGEDRTENAGDPEAFFFEGVESPNGTIFPDVLIDRVMPHLSGAEFKVLAYVVRRTFGFKKESDAISLDQICNGITRRDGSVLDEGTGLARKTAVASIQGLESKGVILCQRRSSPEKGNLPTTFALRFRGQASHPPETNLPQGSSEMYPQGGEKPHQAGHLPSTAPGTALHSQSTVVQPTVKQESGATTRKVKLTGQVATAVTERTEKAAAAERTVEAIWQEVLVGLAGTIGAVSHRTWLAPTRLVAINDDTATISVPHALAQRWIERHLCAAIGTQLHAVTGRSLAVQLVTAGISAGCEPLAVSREAVAGIPGSGEAAPAPPARTDARVLPATPAFSRRGGVIRRVRGMAG
ncbi:MAG: DnaA N-terminal domain-containing protein [Chloroflexota bacterium]